MPVSGMSFYHVHGTDQFLIYNGLNNTSNSINSRLLLLAASKVIEQYQQIPETELSWRYIFDIENFYAFERLIYFYQSVNDTIYLFNQLAHQLEPAIHIDFGENRMPAYFLTQQHKDVGEFFDRANKKGYIFNIWCFLQNKHHTLLNFLKEEDLYQVIHHRSKKETHVVSEWGNFLGQEVTLPMSFATIPEVFYDDYICFLIESYHLPKLDLQEGVYFFKVRMR